jgi:hypothetical protein
MKKHLASGALALMLVPPLARAQAAERRYDARAFVVGELGVLIPNDTFVSGKRTQSEYGYYYFGIHAGWTQPFDARYGLTTLARLSTADTGMSENRGGSRYRIDLATGPALHKSYGQRLDCSVSLPVGLTIARSRGGTGRIVEESYGSADDGGYGTGWGINGGPLGACDFRWGHGALRIDLGWTFHQTWINRRTTLVGTPAAPAPGPTSATASTRYFDQTLMLGVGYAFMPN